MASTLEKRTDIPNSKPKTDRRNGKATDNMRMASTENFALFLLAGIKSAISNPRAVNIFSRTAVKRIIETVDWEISRIKDMQAMRKEGK